MRPDELAGIPALRGALPNQLARLVTEGVAAGRIVDDGTLLRVPDSKAGRVAVLNLRRLLALGLVFEGTWRLTSP